MSFEWIENLVAGYAYAISKPASIPAMTRMWLSAQVKIKIK